MAEAAIAPHVDHDVAVETLAELDRHLGGEGHRLGIVAIDVEDRRLDALRHIRRIGRGACELRARREADLVVDDEVDTAAGIVAADAGEAEAFPHDALAGKRRIPMDQHRQRGLVLLQVAGDRLDRADLAQHDRVLSLKMRGVGDQRHVDADPVELAVGRGAEMVFHVARTGHVLRIVGAAAEFVEDDAERLGHHIGEHVQAAAMRHAEHDLAHAELAAIFDDAFERRDHALAAVQAEPLSADIFPTAEFLPLLGLDHLVQDRLLAERAELDRLVLALHPVLEEAALLHVGDVHIFEADIPAVVRAQDADEFTYRRPLQAHRAAEIDRAVEIGVGKAVILGREIGRHLALGKAERIEIGGEVPAHPIGADQQHRADRIRGGPDDIFLRWRRGGRCGLGATLGGLGRRLHLGRVERGRQIVGRAQRPVGLAPARAARIAFEPLEETTPAGLDAVRRYFVPRVQRVDERRAYAPGDVSEILAFVAHWLFLGASLGR
ncbi:hypothetical protein MGWOODY_Smn1319 [hydrothermal vent metagenome]|uniref:Uncharacterized protein n=1 Tax=hydrothermal vent metagenome TaxID=652676 RepID=A0A160TGZ1_9ZZZZ